MLQAQIYEGTPEQLVKHLSRLPNTSKYKMTVTSEEPNAASPNEQALTMLRDIASMKESMKETNGMETDRLLRMARTGAIYGADPTG